jgi:transposase
VIRGLMSDDEWAYFGPFLTHRGGRPPRNHRRVLDAVFWIMRTGAPWRDLPEEFGNWNSIVRQFRRWADSGIWDVILEALAGGDLCDATLQMIDAAIVRAHHCAAGGKGGPSAKRSVVRAAASRLKSTLAPTPRACLLCRDYAWASARCNGLSGADAGDRMRSRADAR